MSQLTRLQREILLHMTGMREPGEPGRKHFCAERGSAEDYALDAMKVLGLVTGPGTNQEIFPDMLFYYATDEGKKLAREIKEGADAPSGGEAQAQA